ncbi:MAG: hypothetical protein AB4352_28985 [Hormoscilla sp.]
MAQNIGADNRGATRHIPNTFTWKFATSLAEVEYFYPLLPVRFLPQGTSSNGGVAGDGKPSLPDGLLCVNV